uniref:Uncharacterized protein n=2 Tax=Anguilla anguilla TaxID=7936 RepID=A0A0E9W021_ANGAN
MLFSFIISSSIYFNSAIKNLYNKQCLLVSTGFVVNNDNKLSLYSASPTGIQSTFHKQQYRMKYG